MKAAIRKGTFLLGFAVVVWGVAVPGAMASEFEAYKLESASTSLSTPQAGGHGDVTLAFKLATQSSTNLPPGRTRDVSVDLPAGEIGDPQAFPRCSLAQFGERPAESECPQDAQIGVTEISLGNGLGTLVEPVYNLYPPGGNILTRLGFFAASYPVLINVRLDPTDYSVVGTAEGVPGTVTLLANSLTLWGIPSSKVHDGLRINPEEALDHERPSGGRASGQPEVPFMTNPTTCGEKQAIFSARSYQFPQSWSVLTVPFPQIAGCELVHFNPSSVVAPTTAQGTSGSGLDYEMTFPTGGLEHGDLLTDSQLKRDEVVLPQGMTINPSEAVGLGVCTEADLARETYDSPPNAGCPETSKIGNVTADSPLIDRNPTGALYLAKPYENPFGAFLALYMVLKIPDRGVLVKLPGRISLDQQNGQITTTFDNVPQIPIASFHLHFREGARAPLVTPFACGAYKVVSNMTPWSAPDKVLQKENTFAIESGPDHSACPSGSVPPFKPSAIAGTVNNAAGSYSSFTMRLTRNDGEQEITKFSTVMPRGLTGNLTGIPFCPDAAIEAARHKTGREELASPSCPAASEIGHSIVGAGVGEVLAETPGKIYLAGPYHGSALSLVSITSATVGPFDLGTVVIRFALRINPTTAQVEVDSTGSDPIPHVLDGIVVHVREIQVYVDRPDFMINPTNCNPLAIANTITGSGGDITSTSDDTGATVTSRFQAAECQSLKFKPAFTASTTGKTSRAKGASLHVKLAYPKAPVGSQTNISKVKVELPKQLPSRLSTLQKACTDAVFERNPAACPPESRVGYAKAITPILPVPIEGPAYFVSHGGAKWPELILVLQGYGITIDLHGETFIDKGITSSTFPAVPDQPVTSFELTLPQGPDSALAAPSNLCHITKTVTVKRKVRVHGHKTTRKVHKKIASALTMPTTFTAQNGTVIHQKTKIAVAGCARHKSSKGARRARR